MGPQAGSSLRKATYEPEMSIVLDAFLEFNGRINALRDGSEIQSRVFELIFRLMPVEGVAILLADHDGDGLLSAAYRRIGSVGDEPFPIDDAVTEKALRDGGPVYGDKVICFPLVTPGRRVGLLYAAMAAGGIEWFTGGHVRLLQAVAGSTAVALEHARYLAWLESENRRLKEAIKVEHGMVGRSERMQKVYEIIGRAGPSDLTVLITGESGTGKKLAAKALHRNSTRSQKEMYVVNCAAFTDTLSRQRTVWAREGRLYRSRSTAERTIRVRRGTVFLDEIGECSLKLQSDLLRLIQQREFKRLGGNRVLRANVS